jgi:mono/diheme cytochrome c family protein
MALRPALILLFMSCTACGAVGLASTLIARDTPTTSTLPTQNTPVQNVDPAPPAEDATFKTKIVPFLKKYCLDCHNSDKAAGGLTLDGYQSEAHARKDRKSWIAVEHVLAASEMPPKKKAQPSKEEREFVINWIETALTRIDCTGPKDPGRVTIRRLNRAEYNNTIRDLCGVDIKPADEFPADDVGYGFDNIGDVLSFQPILLEKYLAAAERVLTTALKVPEVPKSSKQGFGAQNINVLPRSAKSGSGKPGDPPKIIFKTEGSGYLEKFNFPIEGDYTIRFRGWGSKLGDEFPHVVIRVDGKDVKSFTVDAEADKARVFETTLRVLPGEKQVRVAFTNAFEDKQDKKSREFGLERIEIEGPANAVPPPEPDSIKLLLITRPTKTTNARQAAEKILENFVTRAYRRPSKPEEIARLMKLFDVATKQGEVFEQAIRLPMKAVLVSPHFLYRIEDDPKKPEEVRTLNDYEFATRLSYFLWSSMPDEELFQHAKAGDLRKPTVLEAQVKRMLKDPKSRGLSENFASQWLQLRNLVTIAPDKGYYPGWDDGLRSAMAREAESFFEYIVKNDRSILEFLDADYTFLNERLARHYGIPNITGAEFRQVKLSDSRRGGVVTMASTLTVTSNPTRTSPVKRGKWILENILGTPPPPPAPDVPELPPTGQLKGTLRQQMEQHRANPSCATCHSKLDPLGFGLENFDGIGSWRTQDNKQDIDSSGVLPGGEKFAGPAELRKVLLGKADLFRNCLAEKLLTFALGRGLEYYDKCALDEIVAASKSQKDTFSSLVLAIVRSDPFQKRKGKRSE